MSFRKMRNVVRYILAMVFNIWLMVILHSYVNFLILIAMIVFPIYSILSLYYAKSRISFDITMPIEPMKKSEEVRVHFKLKNPTLLPIVNATVRLTVANPFYGYEGEHVLNMPSRARKETDVAYPLIMDYCGRLVVSIERISLMDLMGICEVRIPVGIEKECLIFPSGPILDREAGVVYQKGVTEASESKEKGYDFSDVSGIREYIPGDKLQNIHWKLSTKKDELMVKERVSVSAMQLSVVVDLVNDEEMCLESVLELADGITKAFVKQNLPFTLYYYSMNRQELIGNYIGNEVERQEWFEGILYDKSYRDVGVVEEIFLRDKATETSYLYIGITNGTEGEDAVYGNQNAVAALR